MITNTEEIQLNNKTLEALLDAFREEFYELREKHGVEDGVSVNTVKDYGNEYHCTEEYLAFIQLQDHPGYPEHYNSINLPELKRKQYDVWGDYVNRLKNDTAEALGAHTSALALFYPPEGFVGWHTNHNSPSYQILFTWSETGDGYFRYQDPKTKEIVTLHDKPGWNVRVHYFGSESEPDYLFWHCAYTKCDRFSFAYKFVNEGAGSDRDEMVQQLLQMAIDEIEDV